MAGSIGGLTYRIRLYTGSTYGTTPSSQRRTVSSLTNSFTFSEHDVPTGRPLYAIVRFFTKIFVA